MDLPKIELAIIKNSEGKFLIISRKKKEVGNDNKQLNWAFPGGTIEAGEEKEEALVREVYEETGYKVVSLRLITEGEHQHFPVNVSYFSCSLEEKNQIGKISSEEIREYKWVPPLELKNYFTTDINLQVADYLGLPTPH